MIKEPYIREWHEFVPWNPQKAYPLVYDPYKNLRSIDIFFRH